MSDKRCGGKFTFLLALAAFAMSGVSLFQQNASQETIAKLKDAYEKGKETVVSGSKAIAKKVSGPKVSLASISSDLDEARAGAGKDSSEETAAKLAKAADKIDAYIAERSEGDGKLSKEAKAELRDLQMAARQAQFSAEKGEGIDADSLGSLADKAGDLAASAKEKIEEIAEDAKESAAKVVDSIKDEAAK